MIARCITLFAGLVLVQAAAATTVEEAQLAVQARSILKRHCADCHGGKASPSTLEVLNYKQLVDDRHVQFVAPRNPDMSLALDLVKEGSMPPGRRTKLTDAERQTLEQWVQSGAAAYPARFDDEFAHAAILADVRSIKNALELADSRYLSLHHLAETLTPEQLAAQRANFLAGVRDLILPGAPAPRPVDPTHTIYRIHLSDSGWHHSPFRKILGDNKDELFKHDLFDLVLLEYPHAVIPDGSGTFDELAARFLQKAQQVRPIPFVRGDWFVSVASSRPLVTDLHDLMKEFEAGELPKSLQNHKDQPLRTPEPLPPHTGPGTRLPALDAWYEPDPPAGPDGVKRLDVETLPAVGNNPTRTFHPGDTFRLRVAVNGIMFYHFVWIDSAAKVDTVIKIAKYDGLGLNPDLIELPRPVKGRKNALAPVKKPEREQIRVFALPIHFDEGVKWRARLQVRVVERYVHPFFALKQSGDRVTVDTRDAQVVRKTASIEIVPIKK